MNVFNFSVSQVVEAFSMSPAQFEQKYGVKKPDVNDENLIFHCQTGRRAKTAVESVKELGFEKYVLYKLLSLSLT